jgi:hypothetical protein
MRPLVGLASVTAEKGDAGRAASRTTGAVAIDGGETADGFKLPIARAISGIWKEVDRDAASASDSHATTTVPSTRMLTPYDGEGSDDGAIVRAVRLRPAIAERTASERASASMSKAIATRAVPPTGPITVEPDGVRNAATATVGESGMRTSTVLVGLLAFGVIERRMETRSRANVTRAAASPALRMGSEMLIGAAEASQKRVGRDTL